MTQETLKPQTHLEARLASLTNWVRLLLPMVLAALGWYVGTVVGAFDARLQSMEAVLIQTREDFIGSAAELSVSITNLERRITNQEGLEGDRINKDRYSDRTGYVDKQLDRLDKRISDLEKQGR